MGEVYRARDLKLNRDVAIKVLPDQLSQDPERLGRLRREAQVVAALSHPNIAQIYGVEDSNGVPALVLELIEGPTLADRIGDKPLAIPEALEIASQIADALEAAHDRGVIHRDLKPANIKLTVNGIVKVLDFGLAKPLAGSSAALDPSLVTVEATREGTVAGTAAYMSPEQARGQVVDRRTDVWSFGCIVFEMLSGERAFSGATVSDTLASVLTREPDFDRLPSSLSPAIVRVLRRCLEKDLKRRLRDLGDARLEIEDTRHAPPAPETTAGIPAAGVTRRTAIGALAGAAVGAAAAAGVAFRFPGRTLDAGIMRFPVALPPGSLVSSSFLSRLAISPDGMNIACNALVASQSETERNTAGRSRVLIRSIKDLEWKLLADVPAGSPFFSPDGQWLGIVAAAEGQRLRKHALAGGAPATLSTYPNSQPSGATWAADDVIYFASSTPGGIVRVSGQGGDQVEVRKLDSANGERVLANPHTFDGGIVFTVATSNSESYDDASIAVFSPATGRGRILAEGGFYPRYSPSGHVVYARSGSLFAVPFDKKSQAVTGQPFKVLDGVMMSRNSGVANFDISANGTLVYVLGQADGGARTLHWVDRSGRAEKLPLPPRSYMHPRISPDGRRLAIEVEGSSHDVFVYDFASDVLTNFTNDGISHWPIWSPDGSRIGFRSGPMGQFKLYQMAADRSAAPARVDTPGISSSTGSYGPGGHAMVYTDSAYGKPSKVMVTNLDEPGAPIPLDDTSFAQGSPKFSPNGRWLAYCTNESGRPQVYVKEFPNGAKVQISNDGGNDPVWRRDGRELFYRNADRMMVVPVSAGDRFDAGRPQELWRGPYSHGMSSSCGAPGLSSSNYDVSPDGERFLMIQDEDVDKTSSSTVVVVVGFAGDLASRST
jgi:serine/threonine-protein kinase